jgi:hypothetical protein
MAIKNYTTLIPESRTIQEIQTMLARAGARRIGLDYENGQVAAIAFQMAVGDQLLSYRLPCRSEQIYHLLATDGRAQQVMKDKKIKFGRAHARAVGWRIVRDWLDAQLALIETEMADLPEVMLPYLLISDGRTAYEVLNQGRNLLPKKD